MIVWCFLFYGFIVYWCFCIDVKKQKYCIDNKMNERKNQQPDPYLQKQTITPLPTKQSNKKSINDTNTDSKRTNPQNNESHDNSLNNFIALKKLRQTEQQIRAIKGRFKVLKIKEQSFRAKTIHHENILKFNEEAQKFKSQHKAEILKAYRDRQHERSQNKERNLKMREQIKQKNRQVRESMLHQKIEQNKKIKQQSAQNDQKYKQIKMQDKQIKVEKRKKINQQQKQQKQRIDRYKQSRVNETKQYKTIDMNSILQKNNTKQKQLQQLMKMQEQFEKQHDNNIQASRMLKIKLQSVINRRKDGVKNNSNHSRLSMSSNIASTLETRLPEINNRSSLHVENKEALHH